MSATFKLVHYGLLILLMTGIIIHLHVHSAYHVRTLRHLQTLTKPYNLLTLGKQGQREVKSVILTALCRAGHRTAASWHLPGSREITLTIGGLMNPIGWLTLPVPPYVVEMVCRTGKTGQDLKGMIAELPILNVYFPSILI